MWELASITTLKTREKKNNIEHWNEQINIGSLVDKHRNEQIGSITYYFLIHFTLFIYG